MTATSLGFFADGKESEFSRFQLNRFARYFVLVGAVPKNLGAFDAIILVLLQLGQKHPLRVVELLNLLEGQGRSHKNEGYHSARHSARIWPSCEGRVRSVWAYNEAETTEMEFEAFR